MCLDEPSTFNSHFSQVISTSFRSNTNKDSGCGGSGLPPSGFRGSTGHLLQAAAPFTPKCTSTCSIVLTACTDLYPPTTTATKNVINSNQLIADESDPFTFNTSATNTAASNTMPYYYNMITEPAEVKLLTHTKKPTQSLKLMQFSSLNRQLFWTHLIKKMLAVRRATVKCIIKKI